MIIPVRCFTCGKVVGNKWEKWCQMVKDNVPVVERYRILGLQRICCKRILLTHVETIDKLLEYVKPAEHKSH